MKNFMQTEGRILRTFLPLIVVIVIVGMPRVNAEAMVHPVKPPWGLHVWGKQLLDGSGQPFRPLGVNRSGAEYMCNSSISAIFDGPSDATSVQAMVNWNINIVRVPLNEDCWLGINGYPGGYSSTLYRQSIVDYVNLLSAYNLAVILDLHWSAPGGQKSNGQQPMPDADHAPTFWTSVANTFKSESAVFFDLYNEPYAQNWICWLKGSAEAYTNPCGDVDFAVAGMQALINTVRATGATNIIMLGGLAYANDLSQWLQNEPYDSAHNLVASFHIYNFDRCKSANCWDVQIVPVVARVPVIAEEIGENDCQHSFIDTAMGWFDQHSIGYLGWAWDTYNCESFPALISSYDGTPTPFGLGLKNHLATLAAATSTPVVVPRRICCINYGVPH